MLGKLLIFCALAAIVGEGVDADAATRGEEDEKAGGRGCL